MENLDMKVKLAVLWIFLAVAMSALMVFLFMEPGVIEEIMAGELKGDPISEGLLFFFALFWLVPLVMSFLSLTLKDSANRWANIIVGIVFAALYILVLGESLAEPSAHMTLLLGSTVAAPALIAWLAWKWPKQEAVTKPKKQPE